MEHVNSQLHRHSRVVGKRPCISGRKLGVGLQDAMLRCHAEVVGSHPAPKTIDVHDRLGVHVKLGDDSLRFGIGVTLFYRDPLTDNLPPSPAATYGTWYVSAPVAPTTTSSRLWALSGIAIEQTDLYASLG